jgi:hypothetical protein
MVGIIPPEGGKERDAQEDEIRRRLASLGYI